MYHNRVKMNGDERCFYMITNRITGGSFVLGDVEKEKLRQLLFAGQERLSYRVWDYVVMDNHYHAVIEIPKPSEMTHDSLVAKWQRYHRLPNPFDPGNDVLEGFRTKIHDISLVVSNFQQRFTQWFNKRQNRWGRLFGGRFDSVIVDENGALAKMMAYITLNPVRAGIVADPAEYRWCGYAERVVKGQLQEDEAVLSRLIGRELGLPEVELNGSTALLQTRVWDRFRTYLVGHTADRTGIDRRLVADVLNQDHKALTLGWSQRLMLKVRFATKGIAVGSELFVEDVLNKHGPALKYKRAHRAQESRGWDQIFSLKKHRVWVE